MALATKNKKKIELDQMTESDGRFQRTSESL